MAVAVVLGGAALQEQFALVVPAVLADDSLHAGCLHRLLVEQRQSQLGLAVLGALGSLQMTPTATLALAAAPVRLDRWSLRRHPMAAQVV